MFPRCTAAGDMRHRVSPMSGQCHETGPTLTRPRPELLSRARVSIPTVFTITCLVFAKHRVLEDVCKKQVF